MGFDSQKVSETPRGTKHKRQREKETLKTVVHQGATPVSTLPPSFPKVIWFVQNRFEEAEIRNRQNLRRGCKDRCEVVLAKAMFG